MAVFSFHVAYAVEQGHQEVFISSDDTNVLILLMAFQNHKWSTVFEMWDKDTYKDLVDGESYCSHLELMFGKGLTGIHAFTG